MPWTVAPGLLAVRAVKNREYVSSTRCGPRQAARGQAAAATATAAAATSSRGKATAFETPLMKTTRRTRGRRGATSLPTVAAVLPLAASIGLFCSSPSAVASTAMAPTKRGSSGTIHSPGPPAGVGRGLVRPPSSPLGETFCLGRGGGGSDAEGRADTGGIFAAAGGASSGRWCRTGRGIAANVVTAEALRVRGGGSWFTGYEDTTESGDSSSEEGWV
ncbi:unnamed protein product [Pylaiella littoralis]